MRITLFFMASLAAMAQQQLDLAASRDGSVLYFTSDSFGLNGRNSKIYRWSYNERKISLFGDQIVHGAHLYGTQLTDAGSVLYHVEPPCSTGTVQQLYNRRNTNCNSWD